MVDKAHDKDPEDENPLRAHARSTEELEALRERLYARGNGTERDFTRHSLEGSGDGKEKSLSEDHEAPPKPLYQESPRAAAPLPTPPPVTTPPMTRTTPRRYRLKLGLFGVVFFVAALVVSGFILMKGGNTISGSNIRLDVTGPLSVGGGGVMSVNVTIENSNTLPIESATLVVDYPPGTQSIDGNGRELYTERLPLNGIQEGERVTVPLRFLVFGEENEKKQLTMAVEYRVRGSNATFRKEALPFEFGMSASPISLELTSVERITSGQTLSLDLVVRSNSSEELKNVVVKARYPSAFDFMSASVEPQSGEDTWVLETLSPGEEYPLTLTGSVTGKESEEVTFEASVGVANERSPYDIASVLAVSSALVTLERPFLDVEVSVNGSTDEAVVISARSQSQVTVDFSNALDGTVYDGAIRVTLGGNALDETSIRTEHGHYDSSNNTLTWDYNSFDELEELIPGARHRVSFSLSPRSDVRESPSVTLAVSIEGKRVNEARVPDTVAGTVTRTLTVRGDAALTSSALYTDGPFTNTGPTPPIAEEETTYTVLFALRGGTNPLKDGVMTATLPPYVRWLDTVSNEDTLTYNSAKRTLTWTVGELPPGGYSEVWMQVGLTPSLSQVSQSPTLVETQALRITDTFTNETIRTEAAALTTSLMNDPDEKLRDGRVRKPEDS